MWILEGTRIALRASRSRGSRKGHLVTPQQTRTAEKAHTDKNDAETNKELDAAAHALA